MTTPTEHPHPDPVRDILIAAADLLDPDGAWTQRELARGPGGQATSPQAEDAVSWCAIGAITRVSRAADIQDYRKARARLAETLSREGYKDIAQWNDTRGRIRPQVVRMLRRAAAA